MNMDSSMQHWARRIAVVATAIAAAVGVSALVGGAAQAQDCSIPVDVPDFELPGDCEVRPIDDNEPIEVPEPDEDGEPIDDQAPETESDSAPTSAAPEVLSEAQGPQGNEDPAPLVAPAPIAGGERISFTG